MTAKPDRHTTPIQSSVSRSQGAAGRVPPHNLEAEQAVLGGVMLKSSVLNQLVDIISAQDFYAPAHRTIYQAYLALSEHNKPVDLITVAEELRLIGKLAEVGGQAYLAELATAVITAASTLHHAQIVRDKATQRRVIEAGMDIVDCGYSSGDVDEIIDEAEQRMFEVSDGRVKPTARKTKDVLTDVLVQLEKRSESKGNVTGVPTGYSRLDAMTAGLQPSDLIIVAGRPSQGKTALALCMVMRAAILHGRHAAFFSLEMSVEQLLMRMLCAWGKVDSGKFRSGDLSDNDWGQIYKASDVLSQAPIHIDDTPALSIMELRARCRRFKARNELDMVVVDYLQLMRAGKKTDSRELEISEISRGLKALAKELHVPVVALSQLNRKVEERTNRRPMLSDLRESGSLEQDSDVVLFLYRDEIYDKNSPKKGTAEVIIGKQRNGPTGTVELAYIGAHTSFENLAQG